MSTSYQPLVNQPASSPQYDQEGIQRRLLLKQDLQFQEASWKGICGWTCGLWFLWTIISFCYFEYVLAVDVIRDLKYGTTEKIFVVFLGLSTWMLVHSVFVIYALIKKDVKVARKLWISIILFTILLLVTVVLGFSTAIYFMCPVIFFYLIGSFVFTAILKSKLEKREEIIRQLENYSV